MFNELRIKQKEKAVEYLKELNYFRPSLKEFISEDKVSKSEPDGAIFWLDETEQKIIDDFEKEYKGLVYHVIHTYTHFGELYGLLYISNHQEDWIFDLDPQYEGDFFAYAYVKNIDNDEFSEFGSIRIKNKSGGLIRLE